MSPQPGSEHSRQSNGQVDQQLINYLINDLSIIDQPFDQQLVNYLVRN
jgi:hypothetical protein